MSLVKMLLYYSCMYWLAASLLFKFIYLFIYYNLWIKKPKDEL